MGRGRRAPGAGAGRRAGAHRDEGAGGDVPGERVRVLGRRVRISDDGG